MHLQSTFSSLGDILLKQVCSHSRWKHGNRYGNQKTFCLWESFNSGDLHSSLTFVTISLGHVSGMKCTEPEQMKALNLLALQVPYLKIQSSETQAG